MGSDVDISIQAGDPLIGRQFGNYRINGLIAKGGMGSVYLAEHPEIGRQAAVKVLFPSLSAQPGFAERFVAEAKVLARLDHPNVIQIFDFGRTDDGQLYYVMELLKGGDLSELLAEKGLFSPLEAWPVVQQICSALQVAHDHGIVHRDLKLENIHLQRRAPLTIKLLDFGIAKILEGGGGGQWRTTTGMVVGTPVFMSPEQAAGKVDLIGTHTDIYALGVMLYMLLTGDPPFWADTAPELLCKHLHDPPPPLVSGDPTLPADIAEVAQLCLAKNPEDRPAGARDVAMAFADALGVEVIDPVLKGLSSQEVPLRITAERALRSVATSDRTKKAPSGLSPLEIGPTGHLDPDEGCDPTMPATPQRRAAVGLTGPRQPTTISTLSSSVGEVWPETTLATRRRSLARWVLVGVLLGCFATGGLIAYTYLRGEGPSGSPVGPDVKQGAAAPGLAAPAVVAEQDAAPASEPKAPDPTATPLASADAGPASAPDTTVTPDPLVNHDRVVTDDPGRKRTTRQSKRRRARRKAAAKKAAAKKAAAKKAAAKKAAAAKAPATKSDTETKPPATKKPPKKVGAGTMDF